MPRSGERADPRHHRLEDPCLPYSDQAIAKLQERYRVEIARRTVEKHRDEMKILSFANAANEREGNRWIANCESRIGGEPTHCRSRFPHPWGQGFAPEPGANLLTAEAGSPPLGAGGHPNPPICDPQFAIRDFTLGLRPEGSGWLRMHPGRPWSSQLQSCQDALLALLRQAPGHHRALQQVRIRGLFFHPGDQRFETVWPIPCQLQPVAAPSAPLAPSACRPARA